MNNFIKCQIFWIEFEWKVSRRLLFIFKDYTKWKHENRSHVSSLTEGKLVLLEAESVMILWYWGKLYCWRQRRSFFYNEDYDYYENEDDHNNIFSTESYDSTEIDSQSNIVYEYNVNSDITPEYGRRKYKLFLFKIL